VFGIAVKRKAGARHLLQKPLEHGRHVAEPERKEQHQVLRPGDVVLGRLQRRGQGTVVPLVLTSEQREIELGHIHLAQFVTGVPCTLRIGVGQRVEKASGARLRVSIDEQDAA
jgi:hypothetical protein